MILRKCCERKTVFLHVFSSKVSMIIYSRRLVMGRCCIYTVLYSEESRGPNFYGMSIGAETVISSL
jgi:hypothetical protein